MYVGEYSCYLVANGVNLNVGQPVALDFSGGGTYNGYITVKPCDANTTSDFVKGIALSTVTGANTNPPTTVLNVLTRGYCTSRRTTENTFVRDTAPMTNILMGVNSVQYGIAGTTYLSPRLINLNGTINVQDDGGNGDYTNSRSYADTFNAGNGKKIQICIKSFQFEGTSNVLYDHLRIEYSDDNSNWLPLNMTVAPDVAIGLYYVSSPTKTGNQSINIDDWGGDNNNGGPGNGDAWVFSESSVSAPGSYSYPATFLNTWNTIDAQYIRLTFRSDFSTSASGWNIDIASSSSTLTNTLNNSSVGEPLYLDDSDYTKLKDVGSIQVGYIASKDATNDSIVTYIK